jgi:hypothetical protein
LNHEAPRTAAGQLYVSSPNRATARAGAARIG